MVAHWIQEVARSIISFKLSGKTNLALIKNDHLTEKYLHAREGHFSIIRFQYIKMIAFKAITTCGLLVIGGLLVLNQQINIGQFVASEIIILLVISSIEKLIRGLDILYDMLTSIEKLGQVLDKPLESTKGEKIDFSDGIFIELDKVTYEVANRQTPILDNISLDINPTSKILIQGESGAGKSSFLRMLSGIITITSGNIYINELSMSGLHINHYRAHLGLSLSEEYPFEGTIRENLTFGSKDISDKEMIETMNDVGLSKFLKGLPRGLDTILYPEGRQLSFTVAKKIVLARAILKKPKLLILEDALGQFCESETRLIIDMLCRPSNPWALVVVSSNEYWRKYCKEIITMKEGRIDQKSTQ
jgi:ABC-type bacteriocin/lantibiotic exporter with double-glycine peptidase domain